MDRQNYFDILKIPFDPPDFPQTIRRKLEDWKKEKEEQRSISSEPAKINQLLAMYDDMEKVLMTPNLCKQEAERLKAQRLSQLDLLLDIQLAGLKKGLTPEVTTAQVCSISNTLGLNTRTVEQLYREKGFHVQNRSQLLNVHDFFFEPSMLQDIENDLNAFRNSKDICFPWAREVENLFDLLCFFDGKTTHDKLLYRSKLTGDLCAMAKNFALEASTDADELGVLLAKLFSTAADQVFNNEKNRRRYENSLIVLRHRDYFTLLKSAPDGFKKDPGFAETCLNTIQTFFPDRNLALALYNAETNQINDPYEPLSADFYISCPSCFNTARFTTREEAENAVCKACGNNLYITCPNPACKKKIPALAQSCSCGFSILEYRFFDRYCSIAEKAIDDMEFLEAEKQLDNAKRANPYYPGISRLEAKLSENRKKYEKPLHELQVLMDRQCFSQASRKLEIILGQNPELKLEASKRLINSRLEKAASNMPDPNLPKEDQVKQCFFITNFVRDYKPAVDIIKSYPPKHPERLSTVLKTDDAKTTVSLSWVPADDFGITYRIVRKDGSVPLSPDDGIEIANQVTETSFEDDKVVAGMRYGYAVFSGRYGTYSRPSRTTIDTTFELDSKKLKMDYRNGTCTFHWDLPQNCMGVRVLRSKGGVPSKEADDHTKIISAQALNDFSDTHLEKNASYTYRLQCIYEFDGHPSFSDGIVTESIVAEEPPCMLENITARFKDQNVTVRWSETSKKNDTIFIRRVGDSFNSNLIGRQLSSQHIDSVLEPEVLTFVASSSNMCSFPLDMGMSIKAAVVSSTGKSGIICDVFSISGVKPCEIDKENTYAENNTLRVIIKDMPAELVQLHYIVNEVLDQPVWGTEQDVIKGRSVMVSTDEYRRNGNMIIIPKVPEKELCVTVIGEYQTTDGNAVYSNPSHIKINNKPKDELRYKILWNKGFLKRKNAEDPQLIIECEGGMMPKVFLSCLESGEMPWSMTDNDLKILFTFHETHLTGNRISIPLTGFAQLGLKKGTILRIMISDEDMLRYATVPSDVNSLKVP